MIVFKEEISMNPLKPKLVQIIFKNSARTSRRTQHFTIRKINWLMIFKEIIAVENHTKHIDTKYSVKMRVLWAIAPCSLAGVHRRFRRAYCVHHQGDEF
jgi:hypothetical protein